MLTWWGELILLAVGFVGGYVSAFFMLRKNPKYLNVDRLLEEDFKKRRADLIKSIQDKAKGLG